MPESSYVICACGKLSKADSFFYRIADHLIESANKKSVTALNEILGFDPYVNLCSLTLQVIFDDGRQNDDVTEDFILNYSYDYSEDAIAFQDVLLNGYCIHIL